MITIDTKYLRCWSHNLCTIKFASHPFTFDNLNKAVHITNTAVQSKIKKLPNPNENLPENNMWAIEDLLEYFKEINKENIWEEEIYPSMKKGIKAITMASFDNIELKPGRYELFGCDSMITDLFQPYLLEINRTPAMCYYTPISKYVCGTVMEDIMRGKFSKISFWSKI